MNGCALQKVTGMVVGPSTQYGYILRRVIDALLREDVRSCISRGRILEGQDLPFTGVLSAEEANGLWLVLPHLGQLYLPVAACDYMQPWRIREGRMICHVPHGVVVVDTLEALLRCFQDGLDAEGCRAFAEFTHEALTAVEHGEACEAAQQAYFSNVQPLALSDWNQRMLHFERLGAFLDHPYYPTARAKLGFTGTTLRDYSPEFGARFTLRWLAVPKAYYQDTPYALPDWWPSFSDVGLDASLNADYTLLPVHPFTWHNLLEAMLTEAGLESEVIRAPLAYLEVAATLSVRTVAVCHSPQWHLKLPLSIRTLGTRNIRTIKPSTIIDGHGMQGILSAIAAQVPLLRDQLLLTDESRGAAVAGQCFLGFILRRYPASLDDSSVAPVASLLAQTPDGITLFEQLANQFYDANVTAFFYDYVSLTLHLHLTLWIRYGVALESNQQNSMVVLSPHEPRLRLLLKDNDAGRIDANQLAARMPSLQTTLDTLLDRRILVDDPLALAQMFTTITLQLNIATLVEGLADKAGLDRRALYRFVRHEIETLLNGFSAQGESVELARDVLLRDERLYLKYLLRAATLESKTATGATDVNKFYGKTAPNPLLVCCDQG